jgi:outer membrane lipoprotein-sorting protein
MKMFIAAAMLISSVSFAQAPTEENAPEQAAPAHAEKMMKMSKKEAKAACKAEGKKGKQMKACMKEKTM